tara:strand:- start:12284 stop:15202 length:2919 start_codon:yes stop_codon:yes gene_type:complete
MNEELKEAIVRRIVYLILALSFVFTLNIGACGRPGKEIVTETAKEQVDEKTPGKEAGDEPTQTEKKQDEPTQTEQNNDGGTPEVPPKEEAPKEEAPKEDTPKEEVPKEDTPKEQDPTPKSCPNNTPPAVSTLCEVTKGGTSTLFQAHIVTPDGILENGQVHVDGSGKITCVGCNCAANDGATKIFCKDALLSPGLINGHDHIGWATRPPTPHGDERFDHRHDWRKGKNGHKKVSSGGSDTSKEAAAWGEIRMMMGGATSIIGSGGTSALIRNLDRDRGGLPGSLRYSTFPLGDSGGSTHDTGCTSYKIEQASSLSKYTAYFPHVSEGVNLAARNEFVCTSSSAGGGQELATNKAAFIHAIGLNASDVSVMASKGTAVIWSARTNIDLYGHTILAPMYHRMGVLIGLGTDWSISGSMNMLRELQCIDSLNKNHYNKFFTDRQLVDMATINNAKASHTERYIGAIKAGLYADLSLFDARTNKAYRAILDAKVEDVHLVMISGKILYGASDILATAVKDGTTACEEVDVCGKKKRFCLKGESFSSKVSTYSELKTHLDNKSQNANPKYTVYPTFFCTKPDKEPSCVPERKRSADVPNLPASQGNDKDGDGVEDSKDNCPSVFNPIRAMDNNVQADFDNDKVGDACDPCPLTANSTTCKAPDPNDRDADGIKDNKDNCPAKNNPNQEDKDKDGVGDVCDDCPNTPNPNGQKCPALAANIYDIKTGKIKEDTEVTLTNQLVTAADARQIRAIIQVKQGDPGYNGTDNSGLFVYLGDAKLTGTMPTYKAGDRITITGFVSAYNGQLQINKISAMTVTPGTEALPAPVVVKVADVYDKNSTKAKALECVIVKVENVEVTSANPDGSSDYGEFAVSDPTDKTKALRVDDMFDSSAYTGSVWCSWSGTAGDDSYCYGTDKCQCPQATCAKGTADARCYPQGGAAAPDKRKVGDTFKSITGPLQFTFSNFKITPRNAQDIQF